MRLMQNNQQSGKMEQLLIRVSIKVYCTVVSLNMFTLVCLPLKVARCFESCFHFVDMRSLTALSCTAALLGTVQNRGPESQGLQEKQIKFCSTKPEISAIPVLRDCDYLNIQFRIYGVWMGWLAALLQASKQYLLSSPRRLERWLGWIYQGGVSF